MIRDRDKLEFIEECFEHKKLELFMFGRADFWCLEKFDIRENDIKVEITYREEERVMSKIWSCPKNIWLQFIRPRTINKVINEL